MAPFAGLSNSAKPKLLFHYRRRQALVNEEKRLRRWRFRAPAVNGGARRAILVEERDEHAHAHRDERPRLETQLASEALAVDGDGGDGGGGHCFSPAPDRVSTPTVVERPGRNARRIGSVKSPVGFSGGMTPKTALVAGATVATCRERHSHRLLAIEMLD